MTQPKQEQLITSGGNVEENSAGGPGLYAGRTGFSDRELVRFVALHGAVAVEHIIDAFGVGRTAAYRRAAACIEAGLLERLALLREAPTVIRATSAGLGYVGLDLGVCVVSPGSLHHQLCCTSAAIMLEQTYVTDGVITERELRFIERSEGRPIYSAKLGERPDGTDRLHRPDLAMTDSGLPVAVEVELSPKAPQRLEAIIRAWRRASWVRGVFYLCEPGPTMRGVERAVKKARAEERIKVLEMVRL